MALTQYTLTTFVSQTGTFTIDLFSSIAGLTIPTGQSVLAIGNTEEVADIKMGTIQAGTLKLTLADDYSVYSEGFWFKVLNGGTTWLRFYLDQGAGSTFFFFGTPQQETIIWDELLITSDRVRVVNLDLISTALVMFDSLTTDWVDAVIANTVDSGQKYDLEPSLLISPLGLFAAMLVSSGLNSTYSLSDVSFVFDGGPDFKFTLVGAELNLSEIYVPVKWWTTGSGGAHDVTGYFSHGVLGGGFPQGLDISFPKLQDLIGSLLRNFGVVMRMDYDAVNERHLIQLIQRGRAYSTTLTFAKPPKVSQISNGIDLIGDAVRAVDLTDDTKFCWFSKKFSDEPTLVTIPNYVSFDIDTQSIFRINTDAGQGSGNRSFYYWEGTPGSGNVPMDGIKYYNYATAADVTAGTNPMEEAIAGYIYHRFTNQFAQIMHRYGSMSASDGVVTDHTHINVLRRVSIDDGTGAKTYYANKVRKYPQTDESEIEWIKE